MKKRNKNNTRLTSLFVVISLLAITLIAGCSDDSSTGTNPGPDPDPDPPPTGGASFDSGTMAPGDEYSFTFTEERATDYICTIHPSMQGSVTVDADASTSGEVTVTIDNMSFSPSSITITPDTEVTWVNEDDIAHTATSD